jgi:hypothetical protein
MDTRAQAPSPNFGNETATSGIIQNFGFGALLPRYSAGEPDSSPHPSCSDRAAAKDTIELATSRKDRGRIEPAVSGELGSHISNAQRDGAM